MMQSDARAVAHWDAIRAAIKPRAYTPPPPDVTIQITDSEAADIALFIKRRRKVLNQ